MKGLIFWVGNSRNVKIENIADVSQKYMNNFFIQSKNQLFFIQNQFKFALKKINKNCDFNTRESVDI